MVRTLVSQLFLLALAILCFLGLPTGHLGAVVTFEWTVVGNAGNGGDLQSEGTFGRVDYTYRISRHEVTNVQYTEFLNAVDAMGLNTLELYNSSMTSDVSGGIDFHSAAANGSKYQVKLGRANNPVNFVSFFDAMRFTNWLENGQGGGSTESGAYTIGNGTNEVRNLDANYFIPSEDEWYKAAYHKNDGVTDHYWDYATSTDVEPFSARPPGTSAPTPSNTANYYNVDFNTTDGFNDGYAVTQSYFFSLTQNYFSDVGSYTTSLSPYGTFDQGGNVWEWNDTSILSTTRGFRGGSWTNSANVLAASFRGLGAPWFEGHVLGIRIASVPEPGSQLLAALSVAVLLGRKRFAGHRIVSVATRFAI